MYFFFWVEKYSLHLYGDFFVAVVQVLFISGVSKVMGRSNFSKMFAKLELFVALKKFFSFYTKILNTLVQKQETSSKFCLEFLDELILKI